MAPTIRIDDEVYGWLQSQARPFEDTPNSVMRRISGLGDAKKSTNKSLIKPSVNSARGVWALTEKGRETASAVSSD